jgi:hypothetical protein
MVDSAATWLWCTIHHAGEGEIKLEAAQQVVEVSRYPKNVQRASII